MSIATEITRLQTAKANLKTQIEAKGVSVPSTATIDTYATYVQEIPQGGGSGETKDYLKFINLTDSSLVQLSFSRYQKPINDLKIKASTDGENWTSYTITGTSVSIPIPPNGYLLIDGSENEIWGYDYSNSWKIGCNNDFAVSGKLSSLISKNASYVCFSNLFYNSQNLVDASNFILDYENVPSYGYYTMFYNCTAMTSAPVILATTVGEEAFHGMFMGCNSLTTAPEINVRFTQKNSLATMFFNCYGLTTGPSVLSFERMGEQVCYQMFGNCRSLTTAPELPDTTLSKACYQGMFLGCSGLTTAPELPATTLANDCYYSMFKGCTSLTTAPILPADNINKGNSYREMFNGCTNLNSITCLATIFNTGNTRQWVTNVASQGTFYCASGKTNSWAKGENGCPENWTIQEYSPQTGVEIVINDAAPCIGDPYMGECLDVSAFTYSIVSVDPNDGETEFDTFASATIENAMYGESVRFEITDSATTSGITSITLDDSDGIKLTIVGEFDTANTYAVKCSTVGIDDGITRYGYAMDGNSNNYFNLSEDISVTPDFYNELMPLRTLTIEGVPTLPNDATHIEVTDDDKFGIEIAWNGEEMDVDTSVWTGDEGSGDRITVTYDDTEQTITIAADWDTYEGEGSGEYNLRMKAETDSCTVEEGDEGTYSLQWSGNELSKTITFDGGTCTPFE